MQQLNARDVYILLKKDPTAEMIKKINARINTLHGDGYISDSTLQYLLITIVMRGLGVFNFSLKFIRRIVQDGLLYLVVIRLPKNISICGSSAKTFGTSDFLIREGYQ